MALITDLIAKLTLDSNEFKSELSRATTAMENFASKAKTALEGVAAAFALYKVVESLSNILETTTERIETLAHTSAKLQIGVKALQELNFAAKLAGVGTDQLNNAIKFMEKNIGNAAQGMGAAAPYLDQLGLSAAKLSQLNTHEQFLAIAKALSEVKNSAQFASIAIGLFGRGATSIFELLRSDITSTEERFKSLGVELSTGQVAGVLAYAHEVKTLGTLWEGFQNQLTAALAGPLFNFLKWIEDSIQEMGGMSKAADSVAHVIISTMDISSKAIGLFINSLHEVSTEYNYLKLKAEEAALAADGYLITLSEGQRKSLINEIVKTSQDLSKSADTLEKGNFFSKLGEKLENIEKKTSEFNEEIKKSKVLLDLAEKSNGSITDNGSNNLKIQKEITAQLQERLNIDKEQLSQYDKEQAALDRLINRSSQFDTINTKGGKLLQELTVGGDNNILKQFGGNLYDQALDAAGKLKDTITTPSFQKDSAVDRLGDIMSAFDKLTYNPPNEQTRAKLELKIITDTSPLLQSKIIQSQENADKIVQITTNTINSVSRSNN